jgi:hypothetical protein
MVRYCPYHIFGVSDEYPAHPSHHLLIRPGDDNQWLLGLPAWLMWGMLGIRFSDLGCDHKFAPFCPTSEPESATDPSKTPINILLIHLIISWYVQVMIINDFQACLPGWCGSCWVLDYSGLGLYGRIEGAAKRQTTEGYAPIEGYMHQLGKIRDNVLRS